MIEWIIANRDFEGHELIFSTPQAFMTRSPGTSAIAAARVDRTAAHLSRLLQRHARHQAGAAPRRGAARPGRACGPGFRRKTRSSGRNSGRGSTRPGTISSSPSSMTSSPAPRYRRPGTRCAPCRDAPASLARRSSSRRRGAGRTACCRGSTSIRSSSSTPSESPFSGFVEAEPYLDFDDWRGRWLADEAGKAGSVPGDPARFQPADPAHPLSRRSRRRGSRQFRVMQSGPPPAADRPGEDLSVSPRGLANGRLQVGLGEGGIDRIAFDGRDLLGPGGIGLHLRRDTTDTWTFHTDRWEEPVEARLGGGAWQVEESGPLRARARLDGRLGSSRVTWTVSLCSRRSPTAHRPPGQFRRALPASADADRTRLRRPRGGPTASPAPRSIAPAGRPNGRFSAGRG